MSERTIYLRPNISIDVLNKNGKRFYIHNWKGLVYRVFDSATELFKHIKGAPCWCLAEFENEIELDEFLNQ